MSENEETHTITMTTSLPDQGRAGQGREENGDHNSPGGSPDRRLPGRSKIRKGKEEAKKCKCKLKIRQRPEALYYYTVHSSSEWCVCVVPPLIRTHIELWKESASALSRYPGPPQPAYTHIHCITTQREREEKGEEDDDAVRIIEIRDTEPRSWSWWQRILIKNGQKCLGIYACLLVP